MALVSFIRQAIREFIEDDAMTLAAALAFYAALSVAPLMLLTVWVAGIGGPDTAEEIGGQAQKIAGPTAGEAIANIIQNAQERPDLRKAAGIVSIFTVVLAATGVFAQLQYSMNKIWDVTKKPDGALWAWIRKRLLSLLMILFVGTFLIASLILGAVISAAASVGEAFVGGSRIWAPILNVVISTLLFTGLFAAIYKFLPDADIDWRATWAGALMTAVLFTVGRYLVELYLAHSSMGSAYGAAGSLLVLLVWIYYSSLIFFFGAEVTQVWAHRKGRGFQRRKHFEREAVVVHA